MRNSLFARKPPGLMGYQCGFPLDCQLKIDKKPLLKWHPKGSIYFLEVLFICQKQSSFLYIIFIYTHTCIGKSDKKCIWKKFEPQGNLMKFQAESETSRVFQCGFDTQFAVHSLQPSALPLQRKAKGRGKWGWSIRTISNDFMPNDAACGSQMPRFDYMRMVCFTWIVSGKCFTTVQFVVFSCGESVSIMNHECTSSTFRKTR